MPTPSIQTLTTDAQQILNLDSISSVRSVVAVALANANTGTPLNPNLTTQQLWDQFYQVVTRPKSDIKSIIANQLMKFLYSPPAPGGAGADKQVIFNDGGVLAGAANLYWDKVNNRVGIGTATPVNTLEVVAPAGDNIVSTFRSGDATAANNAGGGFRSISSATAANRVAQVWLDADGANFSGGDYFFIQKNGGSGTVEFNQSSNAAMVFLTNSTERMRIDSSGNVGIGVTPSAWATTFNVKAFQTAGGSLFNFSNTLISLTQNSFYNTSGGYSYAYNGFASEYYQMDGKHIWRTAASGTAGNAVTFTQAMTLDASGNLCVGTATAVRKLTVYDTTATPAQFESSTTDCQLTLVTSSGSGGKCFIQASAGALLLGSSASERARIDANGNFMVGVSAAGTTAAKTIQIANGTAPTANITGGQLYVEAGALKYRGSSGTVTTIANA